MVEKLFFQSSLPRSGSTLLQNILGQNPDIYATPTSGLLDLIYGAKNNFTHVEEFKFALNQDEMDRAFTQFCNHGIHAYAKEFTTRKYFLDKNRGWGYYVNWLEKILPYQPKVLCMVRDLRDVFCSMEKAFRKNPNRETMLDWADLKNNTIPKRIDTWASGVPIGISIERLEAILQMNYGHKILFIKYEDLCLTPEREMARIYNYLEIPYYQHNFDQIPQITHESDNHTYGYGDHIIRNTLELKQSVAKEMLTPPVCEWIVGRYKWFYDYFRYNP